MKTIGAKKLRSWMKENGYTQLDLSYAIGCYPVSVSRICGGKTLPSLITAVRIELLTKGAIQPFEFIPPEEMQNVDRLQCRSNEPYNLASK